MYGCVSHLHLYSFVHLSRKNLRIAGSHILFIRFDFFHVYIMALHMNSTLEHESVSGGSSLIRESLTKAGKLGLRLLEDLTALSASGSVCTVYEVSLY